MTPLSSTPPAQILSRSPVIALVLKRVQQVANTDIQVLMLGETGVGKSLLAQTIHHQSARGANAFRAVNCGGLPPSLIESELFGYERGAFTGATKRRTGYLQGSAWPGNMRQLIQWVRQAVVVCEGPRMAMADVLAAADVGLVLPLVAEPVAVAVEEQDELPLAEGGDEPQRIIAALQQTNWIVSGERGAARLLGLTEQTLRYRMRKYGIQRPKKV